VEQVGSARLEQPLHVLRASQQSFHEGSRTTASDVRQSATVDRLCQRRLQLPHQSVFNTMIQEIRAVPGKVVSKAHKIYSGYALWRSISKTEMLSMVA